MVYLFQIENRYILTYYTKFKRYKEKSVNMLPLLGLATPFLVFSLKIFLDAVSNKHVLLHPHFYIHRYYHIIYSYTPIT